MSIRSMMRRLPLLYPALRWGYHRLLAWRYAGNTVQCPLCGATYREFVPWGNDRTANQFCPGCRTQSRQRPLWLYLTRESGLFDKPQRLMHVAPEPGLHRLLLVATNLEYVTTDLDAKTADVAADLADLPFPDDAFDAIICSHVLEHIPDDRQAMRELRRVLARGGTAILLVPINLTAEATAEDPAVTDPAERRRLYGQENHLRLYGRDFVERLSEAGFQVQTLYYARQLPPEEVRRFALVPDEPLFICS